MSTHFLHRHAQRSGARSVRAGRLIALLALGLAACSRALPVPTSASPLAPDAAPTKPIAVDIALRGDPPLPGQDHEGWPGLVDPAPSQHHHHQHAEPASEPLEGVQHDHE